MNNRNGGFIMNNDNKNVYFQQEQSELVIDEETGEVLESNQKQTVKAVLPKEPPYIKLYLDCLSKFKDIQLSFNPILIEFLKRTSYADDELNDGGQILYLNKRLKQNIATKCNVSLNRVEHAITEFVKKGYMFRIDVGTYQFNADLFGKGNWADVQNIRTIQASFDFATGEAVANIVRNEEKRINIATEEIANKSFEELTELQKKKRLEQLNGVPPELWTKTDYDIWNEELADFIYEDCAFTSKNIAMSMLRMGRSFEDVARETDYSLEKVAEFHELMMYEGGAWNTEPLPLEEDDNDD